MEIHDRENNSESETNLKQNVKKFSLQCLKVLELLMQGKKLTTMNAPSYGILSLPRRLKDLRDNNGINNISERWILDENGKQVLKEWFIEFKSDNEKKELLQFIERHRGNIYKGGIKTSSDYSIELLKNTQPQLFP